jgi:hypothetical protein
MQIPNKSGLTFRPLKLKGFDRYRVASDGNFWYHTGETWEKVQPYRTQEGKVVVKLRFPGPGMQYVVKEVSEL